MNHVFPRQTNKVLPIAVRGDGMYVIDGKGKRYLDGDGGGASVSVLGHSCPATVIEAMSQQMEQLAWIHSGSFTTEPAEALADLLIEEAPEGLDRVFFVSGGSEAVETAVLMGRQYFVETGQPSRQRIISRRNSYHGSTLFSMSIGHTLGRRKPFEPMLVDVSHISPCYAYRDRRQNETEEGYGLRVADELEAEILRLGPENVLAFVAETVVGGGAGVVPAVPGYFQRIREICDRYGLLLILDEVLCGMGRTGTLHACTQEGVVPDMIALGKGLGAGYQPIAAVLVSGDIYEGFRQGSGAFKVGFTYVAHATACAGALAVQRILRDEHLVENVAHQGEALHSALVERFGQNEHIGDIRGRGLMQTLEFVLDRASKEPFDPALQLNARIHKAALERALIVGAEGGTIDGFRGDCIDLTPAFLINEAEVQEIVDRLGDAVDAALAEVVQ